MSSFKASLSDATIEELVMELQSRGVFVEIKGQPAAGVIASQPIFNVLKACEDYANMVEHRYDKDLKLDKWWMTSTQYDWERKPKGYVSDAIKTVTIGMGVNRSGEEMLIIKFSDTEQAMPRSSWDSPPPIWGIAFTADEVRSVTQNVAENYATAGSMIHREPQGDIDPDEPWFAEVHWLIEEGKITGLKTVIKVTQDKVPTVQVIRFKLRGNRFEVVGESETISKPIPFPLTTQQLSLPEEISITPMTSGGGGGALSVSIEPTVYEPEGSSTLELRVSGGTTSVHHYNGRRKIGNDVVQTLGQSIRTATITVTNATDSRISVKEFWIEVKNSKGEFIRGPETLIGVPYTDYHGRPAVELTQDMKSFEVEKHSSFEFCAEGYLEIPIIDLVGGRIPAQYVAFSNPYSKRIHHQFPNPLIGKLVLKDESDNIKSLCFECTNPPLPQNWTSYEEAIAQNSPSDGFSSDYQCELFLYAENPLSLNKPFIIISTAKTNPKSWYVKVNSDSRTIGGSYNSFGKRFLRKLAYKTKVEAKKTGITNKEVDLGFSKEHCKLYGLLDPNNGQIYGIRGEILVKHVDETIIHISKSIILDHSRVADDE